MGDSPLITVLTSVQDGMPHLPAAVESVLSQTFADFEFLIVDDHGTDQSRSYLDSVNDSRIRLLDNPEKGLTSALNFGLNQSKGEWIARMDADDWAFPDRLAHQMEAVRKPGTVLVSADTVVCDEDLRPVGAVRLAPPNPNLFSYLKKKNNPFTHPVMMFHRQTALDAGGYRYERAQDYDLWIRLLEKGQLAHVEEVLLKYRVRRGGISIHYVDEQNQAGEIIRHSGSVIPAKAGIQSGSPIKTFGDDGNAGQYYYRLGFAAWVAGKRMPALRYFSRSILCGNNILKSLAGIVLMIFPRLTYLKLAGYQGVYR